MKLIDVYPLDFRESRPTRDSHESVSTGNLKDLPPSGNAMGGYQQLWRGGPLRGKIRNCSEHAEPFWPGQVEPLDFTLAGVNHTFRRGDRIMVQVQSAWFPLIDFSPQTFVNISDTKPGDSQNAVERVYRSKGSCSGVQVKVLDGSHGG